MNFPPAGLYRKPSLSAQPGPSVSWGENVTLQCRSEIWLDTFYLSKEGSPAPPQHIHLQDTTAPSQVNFNMSPVTSDHEGTYRCYASSSTSPYLLSHPSDPLELLVSGEEPRLCVHFGPRHLGHCPVTRQLWDGMGRRNNRGISHRVIPPHRGWKRWGAPCRLHVLPPQEGRGSTRWLQGGD